MSEGLTGGLAAVDITPPLGVAMAGYGSRERGAEAVATPLTAQALVVTSGGCSAAMVFADLLGVTPEVVAAVRAAVAARTDIPGSAVMVCGSHTHWGPALRDSGYLPRTVRERVFREYVEELTGKLADCVVAAWENRAPAQAGSGVGLAGGISYNRRPVGSEGKAVMSFALPPPQAVAAAAAGLELRRGWPRGGHLGPRLGPPLVALDGLRPGITDPEIPLLKLVAQDGRGLAGVVNFACHPVVGGEDDLYALSPDYPHEAREAFRAVVGAPLAFSLGCAGDQVPAWRGGGARERVGRSLGAAAAREWFQVEECRADVPVGTARAEVTLALKELPSVEEARRQLEALPDPEAPQACWQRHQLETAEKYQGKDGIHTELWAMRIGDWAAVGLPGEVMVEIGLQIKQQSPFATTAVISLCNDSIGYISTARAHEEGGYEPEWSAPGPEAEGQVVRVAGELLRALWED